MLKGVKEELKETTDITPFSMKNGTPNYKLYFFIFFVYLNQK